MKDTIADQVLIAAQESVVDQVLIPPVAFEPCLEDLLGPDNPAEGLLHSEDWLAIAEQLRLSVRERMVARLIFEGHTRPEIATQLGCAESTVRVYIDRVFAKLRVVDRLGMAVRVLRVHTVLVRTMSPKTASQKTA